jgi:hypothetical protein
MSGRPFRAGRAIPEWPIQAGLTLGRVWRDAAPTENQTQGNAVVGRSYPALTDNKCAHSVVISSERWPGHVRLSDLEPKFTCQVCGHRGPVNSAIKPISHNALQTDNKVLT